MPAAGGWEGDVIDQANADAEAELQIRMQETDAQLLEAIEEALARMEDGTYGICSNCNRVIPVSDHVKTYFLEPANIP